MGSFYHSRRLLLAWGHKPWPQHGRTVILFLRESGLKAAKDAGRVGRWHGMNEASCIFPLNMERIRYYGLLTGAWVMHAIKTLLCITVYYLHSVQKYEQMV